MTDLSGKKFGRLTVLSYSDKRKGFRFWLCGCDCGTMLTAREDCLRTGNTKSCGCFQRELAAALKRSHGHTRIGWKSRTYRCWANMRNRCTNSKCKTFSCYGGRGITVCERWLNSFECFLDDMGEQPTGMTIERIDNNGNYEPGNCRWATRYEQANNQRTNVILEFQGKRQTLSEWAKELGRKKSAIAARLRRGWSACDALTKPMEGKFRARTSNPV